MGSGSLCLFASPIGADLPLAEIESRVNSGLRVLGGLFLSLQLAAGRGNGGGMALLFAFLVGVLTGLRSLTPAASTAWAARLGWLRLPHRLAWIGATPLMVTSSLAALAELMLDKQPNAPSRTAPPGLLARIILGGLTGACVAIAGGSGPVSWNRGRRRRRDRGLLRRLRGAGAPREGARHT